MWTQLPGEKRIALDDENLQYTGRIDFADPQNPVFLFTASFVRFRMTGQHLRVVLTNTHHLWENRLGVVINGGQFGVRFEYAEQPSPDGLAQAFIIGEKFVGNDTVCLVLGDNIFYGQSFTRMLRQAVADADKGMATVFGYRVGDPERYGVVEFDESGRAISIEEKPVKPRSNYAVVGLYFYPNRVVEVAKQVKPSARGELEITSVNQVFLQSQALGVQLMGRGFAWLDTGTHESLYEASNFIETIEHRQGLKVASLEEIAYRMGWIDKEHLLGLAEPMKKNQYGQYLIRLANDEL